MPPGSASISRRAATLTPSPKMSFSSTITSPRLMPMRTCIHRVGETSRHPALNLGSAQHRIGDAVELEQHAVAGGLDDAAAFLGDGRIDELEPMGLETRECPSLIDLHQATVADHVSGDDSCEPAFWSGHVHLSGSFAEQSNR